ncbi:hypothetical protein FLONG3_2861 [Fusarium longipes]|uniref:Uncharacterized protein n=1 Tax=Fusarium longipes TaxID=694270 RepID=A0A395T3A1_9HYPO|nr:hypothetical protein FLONG3_2861 [Fusarium longipes]
MSDPRNQNRARSPTAGGFTPGFIPNDALERLYQAQGIANRLAADQDLEILTLAAEIDRLRGDIDDLSQRVERTETRSTTMTIGVIVLCVAVCISFTRRV